MMILTNQASTPSSLPRAIGQESIQADKNTSHSFYSRAKSLGHRNLTHGEQVLSMQKQIAVYAKQRNRFNNKADCPALALLAKTSDLCSSMNPFLIGGVNEGDLVDGVLSSCPLVKIRGFEIQPSVYVRAKQRFKSIRNVEVLNLGWGEASASGLTIGGAGGKGGLYNPKGSRFEKWGVQNATASTVGMHEWCELHHITTTAYVVIDVEGFEPKVLRGMHLDNDVNQRRFPHIQFELGGTWAQRDPRHGGRHEWSQFDAAIHMQTCGYLLFMIAFDGWMTVHPGFFKEGPHMLEEHSNGKFVQGNLLCLHSKYASHALLQSVASNAVGV